jgi:drug/metabolite transporter (DMT)-like permease
MRHHVQIALVIAALLYGLGGLFMLLAPESAHKLLFKGSYDPAGAALLTAAVLGFAAIFLIAAHDGTRPVLHISAVALLFMGVAWAQQMLMAGNAARNAVTVVGLILDLAIAFYLVIALSEGVARLETTVAGGPARRRPAAEAAGAARAAARQPRRRRTHR